MPETKTQATVYVTQETVYVWRGPSSAVEIWPAGAQAGAAPLLSEVAAAGRPLSRPLDPAHPQVKAWLAFGLIEAAKQPQSAPQAAPQAAPAKPADEAAADAAGETLTTRKDKRNG